jgi:hypothetical protein
MQWLTLTKLAAINGFTAAAADAVAEYNRALDQLLQNRERHSAYVQRVRDEDVSEVDFDQVIAMPANRAHNAMLLQQELKLRHRYNEVEEQVHQELCRLWAIAGETFEKAKKDIHARLLKIGYHEPVEGHQDPSRITPGMVLCHPDVRAAWAEEESLRGRCADRPARRQNEECIHRITVALDRLRSAQAMEVPI